MKLAAETLATVTLFCTVAAARVLLKRKMPKSRNARIVKTTVVRMILANTRRWLEKDSEAKMEVITFSPSDVARCLVSSTARHDARESREVALKLKSALEKNIS